MNPIEYKEKLRSFNSTIKYQQEMNFMAGLLDMRSGEKVLDYGCGLGTLMRFLAVKYRCKSYGYDVNDYYEGEPFYFKKSLFFQVNAVCFMHSLAHIAEPPMEKIKNCFLETRGRVAVITPNREWLDKQDKANYTADPTVIHHYTQTELIELFSDYGFTVNISGKFGYGESKEERLFLLASN